MIPVSVVTGFLGAGKTTLIGRLLRDPAMARTAVVVNEWGEIGLDHELITGADEGLLTLTTGCLCCAARGDLARALLDLRRRGGEYDRVVIETSGLADPAPILRGLMTDRFVAAAHSIARVLTVMDARAGAATLARHPEARRQAVLADRILISKTDLAAPGDDLIAELGRLNPMAPRVTAVTPAMLFTPDRPPALPEAVACHSDGITTSVIAREAPVPAVALGLFLEALAGNCGDRLLRLKGLVALAERPDAPALIHAVQGALAEPVWLARWPSADRTTRIVTIGQDIPRHFPARLLEAIIGEVEDEAARGGWAGRPGRDRL